MSDIIIGKGSFNASLLKLPLKEFLRLVQTNKGFKGEEMKEILTKLHQGNDTRTTIEEIRAVGTNETPTDSRKGGKGKRKKSRKS